MSIYGHAFDAYKYQEISLEETLTLESMCNCALVEFYEDREFEEDVVVEGANMEIHKIFKQYKKDVKDLKKKFRKDYKNDKEAALVDLDEMNKLINKALKDIKKVDADNIASTILGDIYCITLDAFLFTAGLKLATAGAVSLANLTQSQLVGQVVAAGSGYGIGAGVGTKIGRQIASLISNFEKVKEKKITVKEYLNLYRGEIILTLESIRDWNNALKDGIKAEIKKKEKKVER